MRSAVRGNIVAFRTLTDPLGSINNNFGLEIMHHRSQSSSPNLYIYTLLYTSLLFILLQSDPDFPLATGMCPCITVFRATSRSATTAAFGWAHVAQQHTVGTLAALAFRVGRLRRVCACTGVGAGSGAPDLCAHEDGESGEAVDDDC